MKSKNLMVGDWLNTSRGIAKVIAVDKIGDTYYSKNMRLRFQFFRWSYYHRIDFLPYIVYRRGAYPNDGDRQLAFGWLVFEITIILKMR